MKDRSVNSDNHSHGCSFCIDAITVILLVAAIAVQFRLLGQCSSETAVRLASRGLWGHRGTVGNWWVPEYPALTGEPFAVEAIRPPPWPGNKKQPRQYCNLLRPLIKTLFLLAPYGYIIRKKRIPKEMTEYRRLSRQTSGLHQIRHDSYKEKH